LNDEHSYRKAIPFYIIAWGKILKLKRNLSIENSLSGPNYGRSEEWSSYKDRR